MVSVKGRSEIARSARAYLMLVGAACFFMSSSARADFFQGTLYFTTFAGGENVHSVGFSYNDSAHVLSLGSITNIAATPGADGLVFTSDGFLAVGGQGNAVFKVNPNATNSFTGVSAGGTSAFHMMVAPNGTIYSSGIPGTPASYNSTLTTNGTPHSVSGPVTVIDSIAWAGSDSTHGFYTKSGSGGFGQFGTLDLTGSTLVTGAPISFNGSTTLPAAHGMTYDPYTGTLILSGDSHVTQIDPTTMHIVSDLNLS
ncbi:MAG TPA: hypothetical protein VH682_17090, partial [Gemmataceae bacterium]